MHLSTALASGACFLSLFLPAQETVLVQTNAQVRFLAANLSSGTRQRYEAPGLAILKGLKPDVVAIQEFNYASVNGLGTNTPAAFREMVDRTFGTNFGYFRETSTTENYTIPNGIISRYAITSSGTWDDPLIPDRGFAWAQIDVPGTDRVYVVSVHLKASSSSSATRASEAERLKGLILSAWPTNALVIVAGDLNMDTQTEPALGTLKTFLADSPIPTDALTGGDADTNLGRTERYDYILPSFRLAQMRAPVTIGGQDFAAGLVFDSRVFSPLAEVAPVQFGDSDAPGMQHMAVVKDFTFTWAVPVQVIPPRLEMPTPGVLHWAGTTNLTYTVQASSSPETGNWINLGTVSSRENTFWFTNGTSAERRFFRVTFP